MKPSGIMFALGLVATTGPALAEEARLRDLLADGFEIRAAESITRDTLNRAIDPTWTDGYLILLQKADRMALCHGLLSNTTDAELFADLVCTVSTSNPAN